MKTKDALLDCLSSTNYSSRFDKKLTAHGGEFRTIGRGGVNRELSETLRCHFLLSCVWFSVYCFKNSLFSP